MLTTGLMVLLATGPCLDSEAVTLSFKSNASLEAVAAWASKAFCVPVTVDAAVVKKTLPVAVSGTVSRRTARRILEAALGDLDLQLRADKGGFVVGPFSSPSCDEGQRAKIGKAFRVVSEEDRVVAREVFESDWVDCAVTGARIVPAFREGAFMGLRLFAIRPDSLWAAVGFLNGDELISVNDLPLDSPEHGLAAYTSLRKADRLEFKLRRREAPTRLVITVEPKNP